LSPNDLRVVKYLTPRSTPALIQSQIKNLPYSKPLHPGILGTLIPSVKTAYTFPEYLGHNYITSSYPVTRSNGMSVDVTLTHDYGTKDITPASHKDLLAAVGARH
jgi:hypothetical protein